jgi:hypothetical protein
MTERFRGNILEGELVVLAGADVFLRPGPENGRPWDGYFLLPAGRSLHPERPHRLVLADGRECEVGLRTTHFNARGETPVLFKLAGALGRPTPPPALQPHFP